MPPKTDHAAATAALALSAAKAASAAAQAAAAVAQAQAVAVARLEERQVSSATSLGEFRQEWRENAKMTHDELKIIKEGMLNHKHDEYISGNKFWGGIGLAFATGLASIGLSIGLKK